MLFRSFSGTHTRTSRQGCLRLHQSWKRTRRLEIVRTGTFSVHGILHDGPDKALREESGTPDHGSDISSGKVRGVLHSPRSGLPWPMRPAKTGTQAGEGPSSLHPAYAPADEALPMGIRSAPCPACRTLHLHPFHFLPSSREAPPGTQDNDKR